MNPAPPEFFLTRLRGSRLHPSSMALAPDPRSTADWGNPEAANRAVGRCGKGAKGNHSARQPWHSATDDLSARHEGYPADLVWTPLLKGSAQPVRFPDRSGWALCSGATSQEQVASGCCSVIPEPGHLQRRRLWCPSSSSPLPRHLPGHPGGRG